MAAQLAAQRAQREAIQASVRQVSHMCPNDQQAAPSCRMGYKLWVGCMLQELWWAVSPPCVCLPEIVLWRCPSRL